MTQKVGIDGREMAGSEDPKEEESSVNEAPCEWVGNVKTEDSVGRDKGVNSSLSREVNLTHVQISYGKSTFYWMCKDVTTDPVSK